MSMVMSNWAEYLSCAFSQSSVFNDAVYIHIWLRIDFSISPMSVYVWIDSETRCIELEVLSLNISDTRIMVSPLDPLLIALLTIPLIKDNYINTLGRAVESVVAPVADANMGADGIHKLAGRAFNQEKRLVCLDYLCHCLIFVCK